MIFQMRFPDGFNWSYPGFPSLMVNYLKTNDFFYSGHVGLAIILMCEFYTMKNYYMFGFCIFTYFVEAFTLTVTRAHYSIDLIAGTIIAHYLFMNIDRYIHYIDNLTFKRHPNYHSHNIPSKSSNKENLNSINRHEETFYTPVPMKQTF